MNNENQTSISNVSDIHVTGRTVKEVCSYLGIKGPNVTKLMQRGILVAVPVMGTSHRYLFTDESVQAMKVYLDMKRKLFPRKSK